MTRVQHRQVTFAEYIDFEAMVGQASHREPQQAQTGEGYRKKAVIIQSYY